MKYSARYEGQKSGACYYIDVWEMKKDQSTPNVRRFPNGMYVFDMKEKYRISQRFGHTFCM